ncbi:outer membrane protein [Pelagibacterium montanilacus]|uniref:outer membrane protein n=1 Tax=Pelagibacterium montanilacus TaxID=2185280 RepID=UPI001FE58A7B|nr:outer membrane protein [Pelagibacterium montanilacus]
MIRSTLMASVAVFAIASAAQAADAIMPAPMPVEPAPAMTHDWSGFYAGINAGFGSGEAYGEDLDEASDFFWDGETFDDVSGFLGGVQAGANFQTGMFVLGVEGDIQLTTMTQTLVDTSTTPDTDNIVNLDYFGTVRARAGVALDNVMPYLTGGLAYGGGYYDDTDASGDDAFDSNTHWGWTIGGGVEVAMDESISFKAEYLYTDLGEASYDYDDNPAPEAIDVGFRFHTVRAGVNFHF